MDYYTRNRLLSKIAGNTTNRSNVFLVWISVGFFDGFQLTRSGQFPQRSVQVGPEINRPERPPRVLHRRAVRFWRDAWSHDDGDV